VNNIIYIPHSFCLYCKYKHRGNLPAFTTLLQGFSGRFWRQTQIISAILAQRKNVNLESHPKPNKSHTNLPSGTFDQSSIFTLFILILLYFYFSSCCSLIPGPFAASLINVRGPKTKEVARSPNQHLSLNLTPSHSSLNYWHTTRPQPSVQYPLIAGTISVWSLPPHCGFLDTKGFA